MSKSEAMFIKAINAKAASIASRLENAAQTLRAGDIKTASGRVGDACDDVQAISGLLR